MINAINRMLSHFRLRLSLIARRAIIDEVHDGNPVQTLKLNLYAGESRSQVERLQEYGLSTVPPAGGQALAHFLDGECAHGVVTATDDRRYRPTGHGEGDVILYTCRDKDGAHHIHLVAADMSIRARGGSLIIHVDGEANVLCKTARIEAEETATIKAGKEILLDTPVTKCTGDIIDRTAGGGVSMARMRKVYDAHTHPESDNGGQTSAPNQRMN